MSKKEIKEAIQALVIVLIMGGLMLAMINLILYDFIHPN